MADPVGALINIGLQVIIRLAIAALTPKQHTEGPRLEDRSLTTSTYGEDIPIGYGTSLFTGNVIWGRDIREEAVTTDIGKGNPFSLGTSTVYYYYATFAVAICERRMADLIRIYADGKLIYKKDSNTVTERMADLNFRFYYGTETQEPDPIIASDYPTGETPAYRGMCYLVFNDLPLENFGNRIPQFQFVVAANVSSGEYSAIPAQIPDGTTPFLNADEQVVYDRARNTLYMGASTDNSPSFDPHYLTGVDATTGALLFATTIDDLNLQVSSFVQLGTTTGGPVGRFQTAFPDDEPSLILGWDTPYLVLVEASGGFSTVHMFIEKDTMRVIGTTSGGAVGENPLIVYDSNGNATPYYSSGGGGQVLEVKQGFLSAYFYVGFSSGLANVKVWDPTASPTLNGESRGRGYLTMCALPNFFPLLAGNHVTGGPEDSFGCHGTCIGKQGAGYTDIYSIHRVEASTPSRFNIVRHRVGYAGGVTELVLTSSLSGITLSSGGGSPVTAFAPGVFPDMQVTSYNYGMHYDPASDTLVIGTEIYTGSITTPQMVRAFDCNSDAASPTLDLKWQLTGYSLPGGSHDSSNSSTDGTILVDKEGESEALANFYVVDMDTGVITVHDLTQGVWQNPTGGSVSHLGETAMWDGANSRYFSMTRISNVGWMYLTPTVARGSETLQTVVEDICLRSRLIPADIDASALSTKSVKGYPVQQEMSFRAALEPLAAAYNFYGVEKDGKIVFQFNDGTTDRVIPEDDLVDQGEGNLVFEEGRGQDADIPRALYFTYQSAESDWLDERSTQVARRISFPNPSMQGIAELKMEVALTLTDLEAQETTQRILYESWLSQERFKFQLPHRYVSLLPNDVLGITAEARIENIRIDKVSVSATLEIEVEGRVVEGEVYALNVQPVSQIGSPNIGRNEVIGTVQPRAVGFVLDVPYLVDGSQNDTQALYLFAAGRPVGYGGTFAGAAVAVSTNSNPFAFRTAVTTSMAWGRLRTTMPDIPGVDWNSVQEASIDVEVFEGVSSFASVTQDDMIQNDANTAILYEPGSGKVEVIGFRDVAAIVQNGSTFYRLTGFMRGKRGTDTMASGYSGTTYIIIASTAWINGFYEITGLLAADAAYKVVPLGGIPDNFAQTNLTYEHRSLKPWAPCHPVLTEDDPSVGNWTITFERRTRYNGAWMDYFSTVPLNEIGEAYSIDILSGPGGSVVRTIGTLTRSFRYTEAMAITDYGSGFPDTLYCKIYQISSTIGRGFANEYALSLE